MNTRDRFVDRYNEGHTPWVHSETDFNLIDMVKNWPIYPCKVLELGCGTGTEALWLSENGFDVTAVDGSQIAIDIAKKAAVEKEIKCDFQVKDIIRDDINENVFDFIFDRGVFHSFDTGEDRRIIASRVSGFLKERGIWLSLIANADSPPRESGPPTRSAKDIIDAVEPYFNLLTLTVSYFGNDQENPPKIWVALMRKR